MSTPIRIVGVETSCDETAVGIVENGRRVLANAVASSVAQHAPYGGVIPEIAARAHVEMIWEVFQQALTESGLSLQDLDAVAVTQGPGLPGALLAGLAFAKGLALSLDRPLIAVDHLAAHLYAGEMTQPDVRPPYVGLVVSGGHTLLCVVHEDARYELLGETKDDAVGEAFDKVAKLLDLGYPGGPMIDRLSEQGQPGRVPLPRVTARQPLDFSFSGLKTAVYRYLKEHPLEDMVQGSGLTPNPERVSVADVAASFQETAVEILVSKTLKACQRTGMGQIVVGGGVASNRRLRSRLAEAAAEKRVRVTVPPPNLCVDNGAMVAGLAFPLLQRGRVAPLCAAAEPGRCLG